MLLVIIMMKAIQKVEAKKIERRQTKSFCKICSLPLIDVGAYSLQKMSENSEPTSTIWEFDFLGVSFIEDKF